MTGEKLFILDDECTRFFCIEVNKKKNLLSRFEENLGVVGRGDKSTLYYSI